LIRSSIGVAVTAATLTLVAACAGGNPPPAAAGATSPENNERAPLGPDAVMVPGPAAAPASSPELAATRVSRNRVPVPTADAPSRGPTNAPVTLQVWSDFECPFCAVAAPVVRQLETEFGASLRVVWHNLPLEMHPHAALAAETGLEVYAERGGAAFWHFHDATFAAARQGLDENVIARIAEEAGADPKRYKQAVAARVHAPKIEADLAAADAAGINGTPAFFVNDWYAVGALPYEEMRAIVVQALHDAGR
jgi:protein-disulfide isomerase